MAAFAPRYILDTPPLPRPRPFGLANSVEWLDLPMHADNGFAWKGESCGKPGTTGVFCEWEERPEKEDTGAADGPTVEADPFVVYSRFDCSAHGYSYEESVDRTERQLRNGESEALERALMSNASGIAPSFQGAVDLTPADGALEVVSAVSVLSSVLALNYTGIGMIHIPHTLAPFLCNAALIERDGNRHYFCGTGDEAIIGAGYESNLGPDGEVAPEGEAWLYATGQVYGHRSPILTNPNQEQSFNRATNDRTIIAERVYVLGWECITAAVRVKVCCGCG